MKENKIREHVESLGLSMQPRGCIVVKRAPETIPLALFELATQNIGWQILCLCESELALIALSELTLGIKRGSYRVIGFDDIRAVRVETADQGMTRRIVIALDEEELALNAQREETSAYRTSGMFGSWHAENLPGMISQLKKLGSSAAAAPSVNKEGI